MSDDTTPSIWTDGDDWFFATDAEDLKRQYNDAHGYSDDDPDAADCLSLFKQKRPDDLVICHRWDLRSEDERAQLSSHGLSVSDDADEYDQVVVTGPCSAWVAWYVGGGVCEAPFMSVHY